MSDSVMTPRQDGRQRKLGRRPFRHEVLGLVHLLITLALPTACRESPRPQTAPPEKTVVGPSLRLVIMSTLAGALEPCGCRKDMLGGLDHAATVVADVRREAAHTLVVAAGATFFLNPTLGEQSATQEQWKAEGIARGLGALGLNAMTPGHNDWAAGASSLSDLLRLTGAAIIATNLEGVPGAPPDAASSLAKNFVTERVFDLGGQRVGLLGLTLMGRAAPTTDALVPGMRLERDASQVLQQGLQSLAGKGAEIVVALFAGDRGAALRAAETAVGLDVLVVGKDLSQGDGNDAFKEPELVGETLVVEAPNHLQALVLVDLFVKDGDKRFADGTGLSRAREQTSIERSILDLEHRLEAWRQSPSTNPADIAARERDLEEKRKTLRTLQAEPPAPEGSYFRVRTETVNEARGVDAAVHAQMSSYYARVNDHNREAFADREPPPVPSGTASYVGVSVCTSCHEEAAGFWQKTQHATAYSTLEKDHKEFNLDCVSCHVTGYEQAGGSTVTHVSALKNVQCEECHGPGSLHAKDGETRWIRLDPGPDYCAKCHHEPHVLPSWSAKEARAKIVGPGHGG